MLKNIAAQVWAFDLEWVPDIATGKRVYQLPADTSDDLVLAHMWQAAGATPENPQPFVKTLLCRIVSLAVVIRKRDAQGEISLRLWSLPEEVSTSTAAESSEARLIQRFLEGVGKIKPQLVGFNSHQSDNLILVQRALAHGLHLPAFAERPSKPWEGPDYFARSSDHNLDLREGFSGFGKTSCSLHELATACGIPGKMGTSGQDVIDYWRAGQIEKIVAYNECDALTTYLLWLRSAHFSGLIDSAQYEAEQLQLRQLLTRSTQAHLHEFLTQWDYLKALRN